MDKKQLRKDIITARLELSAAEVAEKSKAICDKLESFWRQDQISVIMIYLPFRNEVDTWPLIRDALAAGKRIVIPVCQEYCLLLPSELKDPEADLTSGTWGILEPHPEAIRPVEMEEIDLVIVPGVAFDGNFCRLGYGAGYYDRFLPKLRDGVLKVAPCYDLQRLDDVAAEEHDIPMDVLVSETWLGYRKDMEV